MPSFKVKGVPAIQLAYRELPKRVANKVIATALRNAAKPVRAEAKSLAPVGKTSKLSKAIKVKAGKRKRGAIRIRLQVGQGDFKGDQYYGAMVELGHKVGKRGRPNRKELPAQNFMRRAFQLRGQEAAEQAQREIREGVFSQLNGIKK